MTGAAAVDDAPPVCTAEATTEAVMAAIIERIALGTVERSAGVEDHDDGQAGATRAHDARPYSLPGELDPDRLLLVLRMHYSCTDTYTESSGTTRAPTCMRCLMIDDSYYVR